MKLFLYAVLRNIRRRLANTFIFTFIFWHYILHDEFTFLCLLRHKDKKLYIHIFKIPKKLHGQCTLLVCTAEGGKTPTLPLTRKSLVGGQCFHFEAWFSLQYFNKKDLFSHHSGIVQNLYKKPFSIQWFIVNTQSSVSRRGTGVTKYIFEEFVVSVSLFSPFLICLSNVIHIEAKVTQQCIIQTKKKNCRCQTCSLSHAASIQGLEHWENTNLFRHTIFWGRKM